MGLLLPPEKFDQIPLLTDCAALEQRRLKVQDDNAVELCHQQQQVLIPLQEESPVTEEAPCQGRKDQIQHHGGAGLSRPGMALPVHRKPEGDAAAHGDIDCR